MIKRNALFWLNRRIKDLEARSAAPSQVGMAEAGLSYQSRQALARRAYDAEQVAGELASLRDIVALVEAQP